MDYYKWSHEKNENLKAERGVSFEQIVMHIEKGDLLDIEAYPDQEKYPNQQLLVVEINHYVFLVPFIENKTGKFLKIIIPSRKATRDFLGGRNEQD